MASAFSHIAVPAVLYAGFKSDTVNFKLFLLGAACSVFPDVDVIAFKFGIPYESQWGHRGFTHSLVFALGLASLLSYFHRHLRSKPWIVFWLCFLSCASHAFLDAMTNGGLGVALYWPFSLERIFLPFRPIQVSPIGVSSFFTEWGLRVISSELIWVLIPALTIGTTGAVLRRKYANNK
ncbi:metal-dependent hydrolase [Methyloglobulus sp.]|uniref:metal-dependent hydrolase n=1 Tax=Methyloglobulus sp. TaxID=2518622 RepID=UPI003988C7F3